MAEQLSKHFNLAEFTKSPTATRHDIENTPDQEVIDNLRALCENVLELVRLFFISKYPNLAIQVKINSGYRCVEVNAIEGGAPSSQHVLGQAADIEIPGVANAEIWQHIHDSGNYDQVIAEHLKESDGSAGWIHVSFHAGANRENAISCIATGKYVPGLQYT